MFLAWALPASIHLDPSAPALYLRRRVISGWRELWLELSSIRRSGELIAARRGEKRNASDENCTCDASANHTVLHEEGAPYVEHDDWLTGYAR